MHNQQELIIQNPAGMNRKLVCVQWILQYPTDIPALVILIYEKKRMYYPNTGKPKLVALRVTPQVLLPGLFP